jgi:hypothetical protein
VKERVRCNHRRVVPHVVRSLGCLAPRVLLQDLSQILGSVTAQEYAQKAVTCRVVHCAEVAQTCRAGLETRALRRLEKCAVNPWKRNMLCAAYALAVGPGACLNTSEYDAWRQQPALQERKGGTRAGSASHLVGKRYEPVSTKRGRAITSTQAARAMPSTLAARALTSTLAARPR